MNWTDAFKLPFKADTMGCYIWDSNMSMIANILFDDDIMAQKLIDIINGTIPSSAREVATYDGEHILWGNKPLLLMRGWGYLTGVGGLNLDGEVASKIQDDLAQYIVDRLNNQP